MKIITPLAAMIIAANVWAIAPAVDKEYDNKRATIINHKYDNLDNQADINGELLVSNEYLQSDEYKTVKAANESLK